MESRRALRWLPALVWVGVTWWLSSRADPPGSGLLDLPFADKLGHMGLFAVQGALLRFAGLPLPRAVLFATALGALDELHQAFVPRRQPDLADLAADAIGALAGAAAVQWAATRLRRGR